MIERVIESWLDSATERSFQVPFSQILAAKGHRVLHVTRHCGMEMGKDVITIDPGHQACAFQLKTAAGRIGLRQWHQEIHGQVLALVTQPIIHPSIRSKAQHRSYLVTNGGLEEEVGRAIDDLNRGWEAQGLPYRLATIVRGELLSDAILLEEAFWPPVLPDVRALLELYLESGDGPLPKGKLARLVEASLGLEGHPKRTKTETVRAFSSAALLTAVATTPFTTQDNHVAELEAWMVFLATAWAGATARAISARKWASVRYIAEEASFNALARLGEELSGRNSLREGDELVDGAVRRTRITILVGLVATYGLWRRVRGDEQGRDDEFIRAFCNCHGGEMILWGEGAVPSFLALYWYLKLVEPGARPDAMIRQLIEAITSALRSGHEPRLAGPYEAAEEVLARRFAAEDDRESQNPGASFSLEALVHLFVRRNWKQQMKQLWPAVTRCALAEFVPEEPWMRLRWHNDKGVLRTLHPRRRQEWSVLATTAADEECDVLADGLGGNPALALLFLQVFPHRLCSSMVRWLDGQVLPHQRG